MGDLELDAGIPAHRVALIGRSSAAKAAWVAGTILVQASQAAPVDPRPAARRWTVANIVIQCGAMGCSRCGGGGPFKYLVSATIFAIGLHPLGARWIQEHFALVPARKPIRIRPLNKVSFNVGYHTNITTS